MNARVLLVLVAVWGHAALSTIAVRGAVWRDASGNRRVFLVNISGTAQTLTCGEGMARKTITMPPRSVVSRD